MISTNQYRLALEYANKLIRVYRNYNNYFEAADIVNDAVLDLGELNDDKSLYAAIKGLFIQYDKRDKNVLYIDSYKDNIEQSRICSICAQEKMYSDFKEEINTRFNFLYRRGVCISCRNKQKMTSYHKRMENVEWREIKNAKNRAYNKTQVALTYQKKW